MTLKKNKSCEPDAALKNRSGGEIEMLNGKIYVPCLRSGASETNALLALGEEHKTLISPLIFLMGNDWEKVSNFISNYKYPLWVDSSTFKLDEEGIINNQLNDSSNNYTFKFEKYCELRLLNENLSPVLTLNPADKPRELIQLVKKFKANFNDVGLRITLTIENHKDSLNLLDKILLSFESNDMANITIFLDLGKINSADQNEKEHVIAFVSYIQNNLSPKNIITISTSYPAKPEGAIYQECHDLIWQEILREKVDTHNFIYGDYAATSPSDVIQVSKFMRPRPAATYLTDGLSWYIESQGKVQEYGKFVDIAKNILSLDGYHGDDFCWSNTEIRRISNITDLTKKGYGGQQQWNEYKIHQHICAILHSKTNQETIGETEEVW